MKKNFILLIITLFIALLCFGLAHRLGSNQNTNDKEITHEFKQLTIFPEPATIPKVNLTTTANTDFIPTLEHKWSILFFGYARCPHLCPATLKIMHEINKYTKDIQFVFITIDPENDTVTELKKAIYKVNKNFLGVTGDKKQIKQLSNSLNIFISDADPNTVEHVNHSGTLVIISPELKFSGIITKPEQPIVIAQELNKLISS